MYSYSLLVGLVRFSCLSSCSFCTGDFDLNFENQGGEFFLDFGNWVVFLSISSALLRF